MKAKAKSIFPLFVLFLSAGLFLSSNVSAQEQQTSSSNELKSSFGIKGGANFTNLYVNDVSDEHMKLGFNAGIFTKIPVVKGFSIQPELLYTQKGAKESYDNFLQGSGEYRFNLNYLELPVLAVFNLGKTFNIHAGGYAAYLLSANVKDVDDNGSINGATDLNADNFKRFDAGLVGGIGLDFDHLSLGARYNYGLINLGDAGLSGQLTKDSKNAGFSVYLGVAF